MTNKEKFNKIIDKDFDKKSNYNKITNRMNSNTINLKYLLVPICIFIIVFIVFNNNSKPELLKEYKLTETKDNTIININNIYVTSNYNLKDTNKDDADNYIMIPYYEVLNDLIIPSDFDIKYNSKARVKTTNVDDKDYGKINNYEFWFKNSKNSRSIVIGISDKNIPIGSINIKIGKPMISKIKFTRLEIYRYDNSFIAKFSYKGYNFNVESNNITEKEFVDLLKSIIKE